MKNPKCYHINHDLYMGPTGNLTCNKTSSGNDTTLMFGSSDKFYKDDKFLKLVLTDRMSYGLILPGDDKYNVVAPKGSLIFSAQTTDNNPYIRTLQSLFKLVNTVYPKVQITKDLSKIQVKDSITKEASTFTSMGAAALHLVDTYSLTPDQAETTLNKGGALFYKIASPFVNVAPEEQPFEHDGSMVPADQVQASPRPMQQNPYGDVEVDGKMLEDAAAMEDEELMDTGMLASLIGNEDIKVVLIDHLPSFMEALTNLGRTIIVTSINKKDLIEYFGTEQYNTSLVKLRRVFTSLGETTFGLRKYIKMA